MLLDLLTVAASLRLTLLTRVAAVVRVVGMILRVIVGEASDSCEWLRNVATRGHQGSKKRRMQRQGLVHWSTRRRKDQKVEDVGYTVTKI